MEIKIVTLCRKGKCEVDRPFRLTGVNPSRKQKCCSPCVFDLKFRGIHLTEIIFKVRVINGQHVIDVSICKIELRCQPFPTG